MKHNHNHDNAPSAPLVPVRFEFNHPTATTVSVAGTFNHWQPEAKTLHSSGAGNWWKETNLAPGTYEYCLVVDGQWMPDPRARESVPNPFGGRNSIFDGGEFARSQASRGCRKFTVEKYKQTKIKNMNKHTPAASHDIGSLAEDARALMAATADVAGEKVGEARNRLSAALERAKEIAGNVRDKAVAGAKVTDETIRKNPYQAIAIGVGVGAILGYILARRCSRD